MVYLHGQFGYSTAVSFRIASTRAISSALGSCNSASPTTKASLTASSTCSTICRMRFTDRAVPILTASSPTDPAILPSPPFSVRSAMKALQVNLTGSRNRLRK